MLISIPLGGTPLLGALHNETQFWGVKTQDTIARRAIPLLASPQGGVDATSKNMSRSLHVGADGVVFRVQTKGKPPRLRRLRWLRDILLMTQPPLLAAMQGG